MTWEWAVVWDLREMGSACMGKGGEGGPGPPGSEEDKQSVLIKGRDNMGKSEEDQSSRT